MEGQRRLWQAVSAARRSLSFEKFLIALQKGLLYAVLSITVIYFVTRFFVLPYYTQIGIGLAFIGLFVPLVMAFWKRPKKKEALLQLDQFYPHNELVTVLTAKEQGPLVDLLQQKAETQVGQVLEVFKKRPKQVFQSKVMSAVGGLLVLFLLLNVFPAATQQEAKSIEEDRAITKDLKDKVKEQIEKPLPEETKKELAKLQKAIEEAKTSEEALKELVKKQKELTNLEQQLAEEAKGNGAPDVQAALDSLAKTNTELAEAASEAQTALSKLGKPIDLNTQKSIASMNRDPQGGNPSDANGQQANSNNNATGQNNSSGTSGSNSNNQGSSGQSGSNTSSGQQGSGQSGQSGAGQQGSGNQSGSQGSGGSGQGGSGQNGGSGNGTGNGSGGGQGGLQGGRGSGGRDLLAIPQRVGEANGNTVDGGLLGKGETVTERGPVPATKGDVRPYAEVIGSYEDSYMQSTDRLQLPSDLQQMVQNYYSSIEQ